MKTFLARSSAQVAKCRSIVAVERLAQRAELQVRCTELSRQLRRLADEIETRTVRRRPLSDSLRRDTGGGGIMKTGLLITIAASLMALASSAQAGLIINGFTATSNNPGTASLAFLESAVTSITNPDANAQTLIINVSQNNFLAPTAPPTLRFQSLLDISVIAGSADNAISFISCLAADNVLQLNCGGAGIIVTPDLTPLITSIGSFNASSFIDVATLAGPYALTEYFEITLGSGSTIAFTGRAQLTPLVTAVPEPSPLALLIAAFVAYGRLRARATGSLRPS